ALARSRVCAGGALHMGADGAGLRGRSGRGAALIAYVHQSDRWGAVESYLAQILDGLDEDAVVLAPAGNALAPLAKRADLRTFDDTRPQRAVLVHLVRELR